MTVKRSGAKKGKLLAILAALTLAGVLAGCGSSGSSGSTAASTGAATTQTSGTTSTESAAGSSAAREIGTLTLAANPEGQLKYNKTSLTAKAGKVSIDFTNDSPVGHNLTIEAAGGTTVGATPTFMGGSRTLTVNLKAGTYKFYCSVPGHRQAGMEGTLIVN